MDKKFAIGLEGLIGKSYTNIAEELINSRKNIINTIINNRSLPDEGLDELTIEQFLKLIATMDSNNGVNHIGVGEREGRVYSKIVHRINYGLVHGIGRSGDVTELQPKAVGSSFLLKLTTNLVKNLMHSIGMKFINNIIILPFATGMSLSLSLLTLKSEKPNTKYVIWPRIDQKTCFKSIFTANLIPVIIEPIIKNNELTTNIDEIKKQIDFLGLENILCVFSTTSCFAPRGYDNIEEISKICREKNVFHLLNNAYGIYCTKIHNMLNQSEKNGKIDIIVSSTDKNFLVPIGGSLIYSSNIEIINKIKKNYPGRASMAPIRDLFITLLEMGKKKYSEFIIQRKKDYTKLKKIMKDIAEKYGETVVENPNNKISLCLTLGNICKIAKSQRDVTYFGSLFYYRQISGIRVVARSEQIIFNGFKFRNYGSHCEDYPLLPYCSFAAGIGMTDYEIEAFSKKFCEIADYFMIDNKKSLINHNLNLIANDMNDLILDDEHLKDDKNKTEVELIQEEK